MLATPGHLSAPTTVLLALCALLSGCGAANNPRWSAETERQAALIEKTTQLAGALRLAMVTASSSPSPTPWEPRFGEDAIQACTEATTWRAEVNRDLWPKVYDDLLRTLTQECRVYTIAVRDSGNEKALWAAFDTVAGPRIDEKQRALPDSSRAQLRDAIEERR